MSSRNYRNAPSLNVGIEACRAAATKAGVDLSGVEIVKAHLDWTWGDLYGAVIVGADAAIADRCVKFLQTWIDKNLQPFSCYAFQVTQGDEGVRDVRATDRSTMEPMVRGRAVKAYYYPCAD